MDMETGNLIHLGAELVVQMLMLYSTSPTARRLTSQMLTGDPFNIDVKLDDKSTNRNVEILNVYLKTMGLKLTFKKIPKKFTNGIIEEPFIYFEEQDPRYYQNAIMPVDPREKFDIVKDCERLINSDKYPNAIEVYPLIYLPESKEE